MKIFLHLFMLLIFIFSGATTYAQNTNDTNVENEIYSMIQTAYIKEYTIIHNFQHILSSPNTHEKVKKYLNNHLENYNILLNLMNKFSVSIPKVDISLNTLHKDFNSVCINLEKIEKELLDFYNKSLLLLRTFQRYESIGILTETFEKLKNNIDNEDYFILCKEDDE